jgi:hypothetical protein
VLAPAEPAALVQLYSRTAPLLLWPTARMGCRVFQESSCGGGISWFSTCQGPGNLGNMRAEDTTLAQGVQVGEAGNMNTTDLSEVTVCGSYMHVNDVQGCPAGTDNRRVA